MALQTLTDYYYSTDGTSVIRANLIYDDATRDVTQVIVSNSYPKGMTFRVTDSQGRTGLFTVQPNLLNQPFDVPRGRFLFDADGFELFSIEFPSIAKAAKK